MGQKFKENIEINLCLSCVSQLIDLIHREIIPRPPNNHILIMMQQDFFHYRVPNIFIEDPLSKIINDVIKNDNAHLFEQKYIKYKTKYLNAIKNN